MSTPADTLSTKELDLLRLLCWVAWSDGEIESEERKLLEGVVARYGHGGEGQPSAEATINSLSTETLGTVVLEEVLPRLQFDEDRRLALKLAYMIIRVSRRAGDAASINPQEKVAYRRLVDALNLPEEEIAETEWAAEQELGQHTQQGLLGFLASRFGSLGHWPDHTLLDGPGAPRL